jgi:hypothetical protein
MNGPRSLDDHLHGCDALPKPLAEYNISMPTNSELRSKVLLHKEHLQMQGGAVSGAMFGV